MKLNHDVLDKPVALVKELILGTRYNSFIWACNSPENPKVFTYLDGYSDVSIMVTKGIWDKITVSVLRQGDQVYSYEQSCWIKNGSLLDRGFDELWEELMSQLRDDPDRDDRLVLDNGLYTAMLIDLTRDGYATWSISDDAFPVRRTYQAAFDDAQYWFKDATLELSVDDSFRRVVRLKYTASRDGKLIPDGDVQSSEDEQLQKLADYVIDGADTLIQMGELDNG